jgi:hypothetical protein
MNEEQLDKAIREYVSREVHIDFRDWTTAIMRLPRSLRVYCCSAVSRQSAAWSLLRPVSIDAS